MKNLPFSARQTYILLFTKAKHMIGKNLKALRVPEELLSKLSELAEKLGKTPEEIVTELIASYVKVQETRMPAAYFQYADTFGE